MTKTAKPTHASSPSYRVSLTKVSKAVLNHLQGLGLSPSVSHSITNALLWAEMRGIKSHGLERLPAYTAQYKKNKIKQNASVKLLSLDQTALLVDADNGFAYPALDIAIKELNNRCAQQTLCVAAVKNSHHCGALGYYVQQLAAEGLVGLLCCNAPACIVPWGGNQALFGTNPIAFACPRTNKGKKQPPLMIDLSLSQVSRGKVMLANFKEEEIPLGWALDKHGKPTTNAAAALEGTMLPLGGMKGYLLTLIVEILSATLVGSNYSYESSSFFDDKGKPPGVGQFIMAINPLKFNPDFASRLEELCAAILAQPNTRLPGQDKSTSVEPSKSSSAKIELSARIKEYIKL